MIMSLINKKGVDISSLNGNVDIEKIKNSGYDFAMLRCGYGSDHQNQDDTQFENNVIKCEAAGVPWGAYLYSYALCTEDAKSEVQHVLRLLKGKRPTLPVAIDMEDDGYKQQRGAWNFDNVNNVCKIFVNEIRAAGYYPMIYTGLEEIQNYISSEVLNSCDLWFAQWWKVPQYDGSNMGMWQYGGETNYLDSPTIPGVGVVDQNKCYKDYPTIIKNGGYNGWAKGSTPAQDKTKGITAQDIIKTAYSLIGKDENHAKCDIMAWYGDFDDGVNEEACCCAGQMYLFNKANALSLISGGKTANCGTLALNFYGAGQLHKPGEVKVGDLVTFSWSGDTTSVPPLNTLGYKTFDHVELCVEVGSTTIKCIGANNGGDECDDFQLKTRNRSNISGCCRPKYGDDGSSDSAISAPVSSDETGDSGIKSVQAWLNNNFSSGLSVDGVFGPLTNAALVRALQTVLNREYGANLDVDGVFGPMTKKSIKCIEKGAQGDYVRVLQGFLICHGLDTGGFDGDFGSTDNAVRQFQRDNRLYVDGIAGKETFAALATL